MGGEPKKRELGSRKGSQKWKDVNQECVVYQVTTVGSWEVSDLVLTVKLGPQS